MVVTYFDDICLYGALRGVHAANDMSARRSDALVAREIEVHHRVVDILRFHTGVIARLVQLNRRT